MMLAQNEALSQAAEDLLAAAKRTGLTIITAESCTAGLLAAVLSTATGASQFLHGGFVTYTKAHKTAALGVPEQLLREKGAVCAEVAQAMAEGALARSPADLSVAVTGVAGPEPDEDGNPVGLVYIAGARAGFATTVMEKNYGNIGREGVCACIIRDAIAALQRLAEK
jgi:nicotinamide-nucleotide amidase